MMQAVSSSMSDASLQPVNSIENQHKSLPSWLAFTLLCLVHPKDTKLHQQCLPVGQVQVQNTQYVFGDYDSQAERQHA